MSGTGPSRSVSGWPAVDASPLPGAAMFGGSACCITGRFAPPLGSPPGVGVAVRCGGPRISFAPIVGSLRCGWVGGAGGAASRPPVALPLGRGLLTRAAARVGLPGLRTAGRQPGRWCMPGLGRGPGQGPGDRERTALRAVPSARLVGRGVAGTPVWRVLWPAGPPGLLCSMLLEPGGLGPRWGRGRGGARCRRARWWRCLSG